MTFQCQHNHTKKNKKKNKQKMKHNSTNKATLLFHDKKHKQNNKNEKIFINI